MDLSKAVTYRGLSLNTLTTAATGAPYSGYQVEDFRFADIDISQYLDKRALQDGYDASDVFLGRRAAEMIVGVYGTTLGDFWDRAQDLLEAFSPTLAYEADTVALGFLALTFFQPTADIVTWPTSAYANGIPLQFYFRPLRTPTYRITRGQLGGASGKGQSLPFVCPIIARDPRKYLQTTQSLSLSTSTQTVTYRGDYPTWPTVTIALGTATTASPPNIQVATGIAQVAMSVPSTTYTHDYSARTLVDGNGASKIDLLLSGSATSLKRVKSGSTAYLSAAAPSGVTVTLTYREAFA